MLAYNIKEEQLANEDMPFFIVDNDKIMSPKFHKDHFREELSGYYLSNRYLKYFK